MPESGAPASPELSQAPSAPLRSRTRFVFAVLIPMALIALAVPAFRYGFLTFPFVGDNPEAFRRRALLTVGRRLEPGETIMKPGELKMDGMTSIGAHGGEYLIYVITRIQRPGEAVRCRWYSIEVKSGLFLYSVRETRPPFEVQPDQVMK